jgi:hypothetical protein
VSLSRRNPRRDESEPEVVAAFEEAGATVWKLSGHNVPDLAVGYLGRWRLVEVKTGNAVLSAGQLVTFGPGSKHAGEPVQIARNAAQAKKLLRIWEIAAAREAACPDSDCDFNPALSRAEGT